MNTKKFVIIDKGFLVSIIGDLRSLDVRGYESNEKLVGIVKDLQSLTLNPVTLSPAKETNEAEE